MATNEQLELNRRAWAGETVLKLGKLDSSLKKNTGFIKKLKLISKDSKDSTLADITSVSLEKYLEEIVISAAEGVSKLTNKTESIDAAVEILCRLHQRFSTAFTVPFLEQFVTVFQNPSSPLPEKEEQTRISRTKAMLRVVTDLRLIGFIDEECSVPKTVELVKRMLSYQLKEGHTLSISTVFLKKYSDNAQVFTADVKDFYSKYAHTVVNYTGELSQQCNKLKEKYEKAKIRTGKVLEDQQEELDDVEACFGRFKTACDVFVDVLGVNGPEIEEEELQATVVVNDSVIGDKIWDNEDDRQFYESISELPLKPKGRPVKSIEGFFKLFENALTIENVDQLVAVYYAGFDNKATRKRLVKYFMDSQDWTRLRIYARFVAVARLDDLTEELVELLDTGFRSAVHKNRLNIKNIVFFSELIKFDLVPTFMVFHKIRSSIMNLSGNIETLSVLFEHVGRYLYIKQRETMDQMLALLKDKKQFLDNDNERTACDQLFQLIFPPTLKMMNVTTTYTTQQLFYRTLIREDLKVENVDKIVDLIKRAHWNDSAVYSTMLDVFTRPEEVSYVKVVALGKCLAVLYQWHPEFVIDVVDTVIENILCGLESEFDYTRNSVRVSQIKYFVELFNCTLIKFDCFNGVLTRIIKTDNDARDNAFRVRLVYTALNEITKHLPNYKLVPLLVQFDYYMFSKDISAEMSMRIAKLLERFSFTRSSSEEESLSRVEEIVELSEEDDDEEEELQEEEAHMVKFDDIGMEHDMETARDSELQRMQKEYEDKMQNAAESAVEDDLERELQKMMQESMDLRKSEPVPVNNYSFNSSTKLALSKPQTNGKGVAFTFLSRSGKKTTARTLALPHDVGFVSQVLRQEQDEKLEREKIKQIVLGSMKQDV